MNICLGLAVVLSLMQDGAFLTEQQISSENTRNARGVVTGPNKRDDSGKFHGSETVSRRTFFQNLDTTMPKDCFDILSSDKSAKDGVYLITPNGGADSISVYCDMTNNGGGWTVIQQRRDGSENFYRNWDDYKKGFGLLSNEFWLGNDNIHRLTNQRAYTLRFDLEDFANEKWYADYSRFYIANEDDKYRLYLLGYTGNAGDAFASRHKGMFFSTMDRDNDIYSGHCAQVYHGGWWYYKCHTVNLNGLYNNTQYGQGLNWVPLKGFHYSFKHTTMKIRP